MEICTLGTAKRSAQSFFGALNDVGAQAALDTRLRASSQLAGFTRARDLAFFVPRLVGAEYVQAGELAPTAEMLDGYKRGRLDWHAYETCYMHLVLERGVHTTLGWIPQRFDRIALICTEVTPERCHRRLAAEHLADAWPGTTTVHL